MATALGEESMHYAVKKGVNLFKLTSWSRNKAAHRQIARMGFRESSRMSAYEPGKGAKFTPQKEVRQAKIGDLGKVARLISGSREYSLGSGVYWDSFKATSLSESMIERLVREGSVWTSADSVAIGRLGGEGGEKWKQVCFLEGEDGDALKLVKHVFGLKSATKPSRRIVYLPQRSRLIGLLRREEFTSLTSVVLFEKSPAKG